MFHRDHTDTTIENVGKHMYSVMPCLTLFVISQRSCVWMIDFYHGYPVQFSKLYIFQQLINQFFNLKYAPAVHIFLIGRSGVY